MKKKGYSHSHLGAKEMDYYAFNSRLHEMNSSFKMGLSAGTLFLCVGFDLGVCVGGSDYGHYEYSGREALLSHLRKIVNDTSSVYFFGQCCSWCRLFFTAGGTVDVAPIWPIYLCDRGGDAAGGIGVF